MRKFSLVAVNFNAIPTVLIHLKMCPTVSYIIDRTPNLAAISQKMAYWDVKS